MPVINIVSLWMASELDSQTSGQSKAERKVARASQLELIASCLVTLL